jgi:hypothetical protein
MVQRAIGFAASLGGRSLVMEAGRIVRKLGTTRIDESMEMLRERPGE